jgi:hypothetical protein
VRFGFGTWDMALGFCIWILALKIVFGLLDHLNFWLLKVNIFFGVLNFRNFIYQFFTLNFILFFIIV